MSEELYTVEMAAERLKLHAKTVLRFIRDGRLRATRIGKSYRILRSDLDALGGGPPRADAAPQATTIVDVPGIGTEAAARMAQRLQATVNTAEVRATPLRLDTAYDPARDHLKIVIIGGLEDAAALLRLIPIWLEA